MPMIEKIVQTAKHMVKASVDSVSAVFCWPEVAVVKLMARMFPVDSVVRECRCVPRRSLICVKAAHDLTMIKSLQRSQTVCCTLIAVSQELRH